VTEYDFLNGQFPFPLSYLPSNGGTVSTAFVAGNPENINDEDNWFILCCSAQQMTDLQSMVAVAAPILFPDTYQTYWQFYSQLRQFPNEIPEDTCMDLCQLIIDCIDSTPALQQAIASYAIDSPITSNTPESQTDLDTEIIYDQGGCDNDILFGMTTGITDLFNDVCTDILQIISASSSAIGRIGDIIEAVPGVGELSFDDIFQFVESFLTDMNDYYDSGYTTQVRDDIRCNLFCFASPNCELTLETIRDYFEQELNETLDFSTFGDFIISLAALNLTGVATVWAMHLWVAQVLVYGGNIYGLNTTKLVQSIGALWNDPDSDWNTICTDCAWTVVLVSNGDFSLLTPEEWGGGAVSKCTATVETDFVQGCYNGDEFGNWSFAVRCDIPDTATVTEVTMYWEWNTTRTPLESKADIYTYNPTTQVATKTVSQATGEAFLTVDGLAVTDDKFLVRASARGEDDEPEGYCNLTKLVISGTGTNPF